MTAFIIRQFMTPLDYKLTWQAMRSFTNRRTENTADELWLLEHLPVFTQGQAGKLEHLLNPHHIPVIQSDRGGQITYHGPGQLIAYTLFNLNRLEMSTRSLVRTIETLVIDLLAGLEISATTREQAPGVYINDDKICSIGLRVRHGHAYHGIALNIDMDLTPFSYINPCGYRGLKMTQIKTLVPQYTLTEIREKIIPYFIKHFRYNQQTAVVTQYDGPAVDNYLAASTEQKEKIYTGFL